MKSKPPFLGRVFIKFLLTHNHPFTMLGDYEELYHDLVRERGIMVAKLWFIWQLVLIVPSFINNTIYWSTAMIRNYLKTAFRNLVRHRVFSVLNIAGLAIGMAVCLLILLWVQDEISYDTFHKNAKNLYIVGTHSFYGKNTETSSGTPPALGPALKIEFPEIVNTARFVNGFASMVIRYDEKMFVEGVRAADPAVLEMFTFPLIKGYAKTALSEPHSIVMSERMAQKYFENEEPMGKIVTIANSYDFKVSGIMKNIPRNSSLRFDLLVPITFFREYWGLDLEKWSNFAYTTYAQLHENVSYKDVNPKIVNRIKEGKESDSEAFFWPYNKLHLFGLENGGGHIGQVVLYTLIALAH